MDTRPIDALVAEIGSTTTLINAFDGMEGAPRFLGQGAAPTTVREGDVRLGLERAIQDLEKNLSCAVSYRDLFATSSAAGGLRMSVHGLVYDMTARAAEAAALGAGAVVKMVTAGRMAESDLKSLQALKPNLILIAGGTDYGERDTALYNAKAVADLNLRDVPVLYAGNIQNREAVKAIFEQSGMVCAACDNVYPRLDDLNIEPARRQIHRLFETHIVKAPGMEHIYDMVTQPVMPTPGAVMEAAQLLYPVMGGLAVIDVGGATTDVHSACEASEDMAAVQTRPEPLFLRTVEGDLGVYVNARHLVDQIGADTLRGELNIDVEQVMASYAPIPETKEQGLLTERLALEAAMTALRRHAGTLRGIYLPGGRKLVAEGKDLTGLQHLIATGGALTRLPGRAAIMTALRDMNASGKWLYPNPGEIALHTDCHYIMASIGVLSRRYKDAAVQLMQRSFDAQG